ncbi:MAG: electron transfer flavoprotein subunit beta, partial [Nitrososphaerales archaeon]
FNFLGNVIDYSIDSANRIIHAERLIEIQGLYNILEEVECPLPALITIDPSYRERYNTVSQRLKYIKLQKEAMKKAENYKQYLKVWSAKELGVDTRSVGLPGSPTIVYKVEKVPRAKASRQTRIIDVSKDSELKELGMRLLEILNSK